MGKKLSKKTLKRMGKWAAWAVSGCLALVLVAYAALQTPWTKNALVNYVAEYCSHELGWKVEMSTPEGVLPFSLKIASLRIADTNGEWFAATNTSLSLSPVPFGRRFATLKIGMDEATVRRAPVMPPDQGPPPPETRPLAFLDGLGPLPVEGEMQLDVGRLHLDDSLTGRALTGQASVHALAMAGAVDARIVVSAQEDAAAHPPSAPSADTSSASPASTPASTDVSILARFDPGLRTARLQLTLKEEPGGMAAAMAGLPADTPLSASMDGDGPLAAWQASLAVRGGQEAIVTGTLTAGLGRTSADDAGFGLDLSINPFLLPVPAQLRDALGSQVGLLFKGVLTSAGLPMPQWQIRMDELSVVAKAFKAEVRGDLGPQCLAPRLNFALRVADPAPLGLKAGPLAVEGALNATLDTAGPLTAEVQLSSADLGSALLPFGVGLGGKAAIAATVQGDTNRQDFAVTVDAGFTELAGTTGELGPKLAAALGREVRLHVDAGLAAGKHASLTGLRVTSKALRVEASGSYALDTTKADVRADVDAPDLAALAPLAGMKLAGAATIRIRAQGPTDAPQVTLDFEGKKLVADQTRFDRLGLRLTAEPGPKSGRSGVHGKLDARAEKGSGKLAASTSFTLDGQKLTLANLQASGPGLTLSGNLDAALDHKTASGQLKTAADLAPLGAFLGRKMAGRVQAEISLAASGLRQDVSAHVGASGLAAEGVTLAKAEISGAFTDVLRSPQGDLNVALTRVTAGSAAVESLQAKAHGGGKSIDFFITTKGTLPERFELATGGSFSPAPGGGTLRLATLNATARELKLALTRPATATLGAGTMSLDGVNISLDGSPLTASGSLKPGRADFSLDVAALPLGLLEKAGLAGVSGLSGTASVTLRVTGTPAAPQVAAVVKLDKVAMAGAQGQNIPPANLTLDALLAAGRLTAACQLSAGPEAAFVLKASLPARLSLAPFNFIVPRDAALDGSLKGDVDLARAAAISGDEALSLSGTLKADFTLSGNLSAPQISGRATLAGGQADYLTTGTRLRDITLDLEATGAKVALNTFTARDAGQGTLSVTGKADLSPEGSFPYEASLVLDKLTPMRSDIARATLSAKVNAAGNTNGAKVKGSATVGPVEVHIPDRMPPNATPIPVEMTGKSGKADSKPAAPTKPYPVDMDVAVDFPGRIFVRGMGLDSMWAGKLRVKGSPDAPEIGGSIRIVKGQLDFFGKNFNLARGQVTFHGNKPPMPMLDMEAKVQAGDITASILVTGNANRPSIDFTSDPVVPRDEILSRVLFGQSVSSLTPPQALQLAQAVATLTGVGGSLDFLGATRKLAGLDYLGVKSSGQSVGQSTVAAGKYVADGVYVEASQGLAGTSGAVSVEVDVTKNITIESKIGLDSKTGVGVNWKFDY